MRNAGTKSKGIQIFGVLSLFLIWGFGNLAHAETKFIKYSDLKKPIKGDGSLGNPYQIAHPFHLKEMRDNLGSHFKLTRSLDLEENKNFKPIGGKEKSFEGTFDGGGKTIRNLQIKRSDEDNVGLFGRTGKSSTIQNVRLEKIEIVGKQFVGGLVGMNVHKEIIEAYLDAKAKSDAGKEEAWKEYDAIFEKRNRYGGNIEASYVAGKVQGNYGVGGLVGWNGGTIQTSYAAGKVEGKEAVGGLVGGNSVGTIQTSYAAGKVEGEGQVGGLVGSNYGGTIKTSYATGRVLGKKDVGGFVGYNHEYGRIEGKNYWQTGSAKKGIGKNEGKVSHLKAKSKFKIIPKELEWDLEVWEFPPKKHPRLRWQSSLQ